MTRPRILIVAALTAATLAVPASATAAAPSVNPCNHRTPRPPAGTVCHQGVWVRPLSPWWILNWFGS